MKSNVDIVKSVNPAVHNADQTGSSVDLSGYDAALAIIISGALTDGTHTPKLQESSDDVTYTDVDSTDLEGSFSNIAANAVQRVGYKGMKRYVRVYVTSSGTTGCIYGASLLRGEPALAPLA